MPPLLLYSLWLVILLVAVFQIIMVGRLNKFYAEICLVEQTFVKDGDLTVQAYLDKTNSTITKMVRYEVGEGMEKRKDDFASEVMSQIQNA